MTDIRYIDWLCTDCNSLIQNNKSNIWCNCGIKVKDIDLAPDWWILVCVHIFYGEEDE